MFHQHDHLKSHLTTHDPNRQVFHCQECGKQYNTQLGYRRHLVAAHAPAAAAALALATDLPCQEGAPPSLLEHLGSGGHIDRPPPLEVPAPAAAVAVRERKYSCERCDRRFYTRKDVRRHAVVHTGRRDFLCPRCAQRFGRRDHLTRHLKKSHGQETALTPTGGSASSAVAPATPPCPAVKEEPSPVTCDLGGPASKESQEASFSMEMYNSYPLPAMANAGMGHPHHSLMGGSLSSAMGVARHLPPPPPHHLQPPQHPPPQPYGHMARYQHGSTSSYPAPPRHGDMDSFLLDLQSGLPPHLSAAPPPSSAASPPQREVLSEAGGGDPHLLSSRSPALSSAELSCAANMDLGPLLGFLPFGLPPYGAHMGHMGVMGVMGYPSTSASSPASTPPPPSSSQAPPGGPFALLQPAQGQGPQGQAPLPPHHHNHNQLPQGFGSPAMSTSNALPRYYQAFQQ